MSRLGVIDAPNLTFKAKPNVPLLIGVDSEDELLAPESVREFLDGIDCDDKEFFVVKGGRHAVFPGGAWDPLQAWQEVLNHRPTPLLNS